MVHRAGWILISASLLAVCTRAYRDVHSSRPLQYVPRSRGKRVPGNEPIPRNWHCVVILGGTLRRLENWRRPRRTVGWIRRLRDRLDVDGGLVERHVLSLRA